MLYVVSEGDLPLLMKLMQIDLPLKVLFFNFNNPDKQVMLFRMDGEQQKRL